MASRRRSGRGTNVKVGVSSGNCAAKKGALQTLIFQRQQHQKRCCTHSVVRPSPPVHQLPALRLLLANPTHLVGLTLLRTRPVRTKPK